MKIIAVPANGLSQITDYFGFNQVPYENITLWDDKLDTNGGFVIPEHLEDTLLIIDPITFREILNWDTSLRQFIRFSKKNNYVWVFNQYDCFTTIAGIQNQIQKIDQELLPGVLTLFVEGPLSNRCFLSNLKNIKIKSWPFTWLFDSTYRIKHATLEKVNPSNDFLLTMVKKINRPHRKLLWKNLQDRPGLLDRGYAVYHNFANYEQNRVGDRNIANTWQSGHPSMDLYLDACLELVPETLYKDAYYVSEKTIKPIATKTPFLVASNCGYLGYLRSIGFKTFDSLIDENYDNQYCVKDRVRLMVDQLEDIIKNGAESFYLSSKHILDHNHQKLAEISGNWCYYMDLFINQCLNEINAVDRKFN